MKVQGQLVDVWTRRIYPVELEIEGNKIAFIREIEAAPEVYIIPGFVDAHMHIESTMVVPARFAEAALKHGTIAVVADPHEIANVMGVEGIEFMVNNGKSVPFKFFFGVPSCVPATPFETSGAQLDALAVRELIQREDMYVLAEMMNFPGVINDVPDVIQKIEAAKAAGKPIDGHAPGLMGEALRKYASAGITTDHECATLEEALEKIKLGMKILIRQGSAARNLDDLLPLLKTNPHDVMFCTDDCHPDDLMNQHINEHVRTAVAKGYDLFDVLHAASVNPVLHYKLPVGLLREGDPADFLMVSNLETFEVRSVYLAGEKVWENSPLFSSSAILNPINSFYMNSISEEDIKVSFNHCSKVKVIEVIDGQLLTRKKSVSVDEMHNVKGINKMLVLNRYTKAKPAVGYVYGFNLQVGAIATSVAHDSHNIIAVGATDEALIKVVTHLQELKGGMVVYDGREIMDLPLPLAGLMSDKSVEEVGIQYHRLNEKAKMLGIPLRAPFMTLSFLSLLVIPELKLGDRGLFDVEKFQFVSLCD
jgi:adenine deaminase